MKKQGTENREQGTGDSPETLSAGTDISGQIEVAAGVKPRAKARTKKVAGVAEPAAPNASSEAAAEEVKAKPAKKATVKKGKPASEAAQAPEVAASVDPTPDKAKAAKRAVNKAGKKDKGRDLVVDEPGAEEIAEVLHTPAAPVDEAPEDAAAAANGPEPKLERLQKILAKAGISSRRKAEELILGGRVQINGKIVMELGTKADPERDHVRVDGKLLAGPERIRYFVLNKPKGFVTTVSDPEGRPTVMQFFAGEHERLYPVGRLDYLSEGLLLVTNDGELANKLTKAASGVEKTYLVKVAGQPSEAGLDALRTGVVIERGRGIGSGRVRTAPAQIRQVRQGDNPWYEVIVIEGRNRELRKMFEEIGHHVEKIRRVGYGPLILDLEPGKLRELEAEEVQSLRLAADGKLKKKSKRSSAAGQLPTVAGKTVRYKNADGKPGYEPRVKPAVRPEFQVESPAEERVEFKRIPKAAFGAGGRPEFKPSPKGEFRPQGKADFKGDFKPRPKPGFRPEGGTDFKPRPKFGSRPESGGQAGGRGGFAGKPRAGRAAEPPVTDYVLPPRKGGPLEPESDFDTRPQHQGPGFNPEYKPGFRTGAKPAFRAENPGSKPAFRGDGPPKRFAGGDSARPSRPFKPAGPRTDGPRPAGRYNAADDDFVPTKTPGFRVEPVEDKPRAESPRSGGFDRAGGGGRPFRPNAGGAGKPFRAAGARPASGDRPDRPRTDRPAGDARPYRPRTERPDSRAAAGGRPFRPSARPDSRTDSRTESRSGSERPARFAPRTDGPPARRGKPFGAGHDRGDDRPREFRPRTERPARTGDGPPKKFAGARPAAGGGAKAAPSRTGPARKGPNGEPNVKERWRNSFTGKNKGRPKPKKAE